MFIDIEYQIIQERCAHCGQAHDVARGPVLDEGSGIGLYLAGMHHCDGPPGIVMTVSLLHGEDIDSYTLQIWTTSHEIQMGFLDSSASPWAAQGYLGTLVSAEDARQRDDREIVFEVADLICVTIPEVGDYLDRTPGPAG